MNRFSLSIRGDNEPYPVDQNITLGRHLDNDIVLAGEDVFEYHARLELTPRGPALVELGGAVVLVNDKPIEGSTGLAPGDRISIGQYTLILVDDGASGSIENWKMKSLETEQVIELANDVLIGRGEDCNLQINESHISREHACMTTTSSSVWLKDLRSSNGTFVNGDRVTGSWELFHGDEIFFDRSGYQLIAEAPDITPVVTHRGHFSEQQAILKANALATELKAAGTA